MVGILVALALWAIYALTHAPIVKVALVVWLVFCIVAWLLPQPPHYR